MHESVVALGAAVQAEHTAALWQCCSEDVESS